MKRNFQPRAFYYLGSWVLDEIDKIIRIKIYYFPKEYKYNIRVPERNSIGPMKTIGFCWEYMRCAGST